MTFQLDDTFALLERTPGVLGEQLAGLPTAWMLTDDGVLDQRGLHPTLGEVTMRELCRRGSCTT